MIQTPSNAANSASIGTWSLAPAVCLTVLWYGSPIIFQSTVTVNEARAGTPGSATGRLVPMAATEAWPRGVRDEIRAFEVDIEASSAIGRISMPAARKFG